MGAVKRITANLPAGLLEDAMKVSQKSMTETIVEGLELVRRRRAHAKATSLRGKVRLDVDIDESRERRR